MSFHRRRGASGHHQGCELAHLAKTLSRRSSDDARTLLEEAAAIASDHGQGGIMRQVEEACTHLRD
jgi:hypothetical protein